MSEIRPAVARLGMTALNLLVPGLGLLKLGRWQAAAVAFGIVVGVSLFLYAGPAVPFAALLALISLALIAYLASMVMTWIVSRERLVQPPWYSSGWVVFGAALAMFALSYVLTGESRNYRSFYLPAESMTPVLPKGARFIAHMETRAGLRRGEVVLIRTQHDDIYVKRVVGLPADRISLAGGIVSLNGRAIAQHQAGVVDVGGVRARRLIEKLPGEEGSHYVLDEGVSQGDDFDEVRVRPNHIFVLGDARDRSADSRFPVDMMGLEQVPTSNVAGKPLYHSVGSSRPLGTAISR